MALKKLKGARLTTPSVEMVDTKAMGRGTTTPVRIMLNRSKVLGSMSIGESSWLVLDGDAQVQLVLPIIHTYTWLDAGGDSTSSP